MNVAISEITIGERHRKELGDIDVLADSIEKIGLLHPIVITPDKQLVAGGRRLEAYRRRGWKTIPVRIIDIDSVASGELAENVIRKDFVPSEAVAVFQAVRAIEVERAKARQGTRTDIVETFHDVEAGKARDKAARGVGFSGRTLEKAEAIVEAAEHDPERFGKLLADMDRTGRVNGVHKRLVVAKKAEAIRAEPPPLPTGPFRVIVADPPWPFEFRVEDPSRRGTTPYPQMSLDQIKAMDVASITHDDCILWLWTTNCHMRFAFEVLDAWGFEQKVILTWVKKSFGTGDWLRGQTEHCLLATKGKPVVTLAGQSTVIEAKRREHSRKPDAFYDLVDGLCPGSKVELFQRYPRDGWTGHGDEVAP